MTCPAGLSTRPARAWPEPRSGRSAAVGATRDGGQRDDRRRGPVRPAGSLGSRGREGRDRRRHFGLFARAGDGRVGWLNIACATAAEERESRSSSGGRRRPGPADRPERPADRRCRGHRRSHQPVGRAGSGRFIRLSPEADGTVPDHDRGGRLVRAQGHPQGAGIFAAIAAPAFGSPTISWDTTRPTTIALDGRLGPDQGRLKLPDARGLPDRLGLGLHSSPQPSNAVPGPYEVFCQRDSRAGKDGTFEFDNLPPGRYVVKCVFRPERYRRHQAGTRDRGRPRRRCAARDPAPAAADDHRPARRRGDRQGIAGVALQSFCMKTGKTRMCTWARPRPMPKDGTGSRRRPGTVRSCRSRCQGPISSPNTGDPRPGGQGRPDLARPEAFQGDGARRIVVDRELAGRSSAPRSSWSPPTVRESARTTTRPGPVPAGRSTSISSTPTTRLAMRANQRGNDRGAVVVRPKEVQGKLALTIDPRIPSGSADW